MRLYSTISSQQLNPVAATADDPRKGSPSPKSSGYITQRIAEEQLLRYPFSSPPLSNARSSRRNLCAADDCNVALRSLSTAHETADQIKVVAKIDSTTPNAFTSALVNGVTQSRRLCLVKRLSCCKLCLRCVVSQFRAYIQPDNHMSQPPTLAGALNGARSFLLATRRVYGQSDV